MRDATDEPAVAGEGRIRAAVRRDRALLVGGLVVVFGVAWAHLARMAAEMTLAEGCHSAFPVASSRPWSSRELAAAAVMWAVMMLAMMLPVVSPWVLAFPRAAHDRGAGGSSSLRAWAFLLGYGAAWLAYCGLAAGGQLALQRAALLSRAGVLTSPAIAGGLLLLAGVYQLSPQRDACIVHCRSPMAFFLARWRDGYWGAFTMGGSHGAYCLGCCWALMALSFVFGVMNLAWMAAITGFLVVEKATSAGPWMGRAAGVLLLACAAWTLARAA